MKTKKGQVTLGSAPTVVLLVGLVFLVMATVAFIGEKYGASMPADHINTVINQTLITVNEAGERIDNSTSCNLGSFTVTQCVNSTSGIVISTGNYTVTTTTTGGIVKYIGVLNNGGFNNSNWKCSYTHTFAGVACEVNNKLQTEISNNTSIAGIVLTISLVGIVLTVLIGVFIGVRRTKI